MFILIAVLMLVEVAEGNKISQLPKICRVFPETKSLRAFFSSAIWWQQRLCHKQNSQKKKWTAYDAYSLMFLINKADKQVASDALWPDGITIRLGLRRIHHRWVRSWFQFRSQIKAQSAIVELKQNAFPQMQLGFFTLIPIFMFFIGMFPFFLLTKL